MKRIRSTRTTMLLAALMTAGAVSANAPAGDGDELSLEALMNIKLQTGSFLELDLAKSPLSMTIIDRRKIELSGARDLTDALEVYVPGFQYMYNRWNGKIWGMRGVANDRNTKFIVLVNGHKMNTEARDGFFQEISLGMLGDVERIEVLRGPAGLVYGSGAIAGIVNIVTRKADKTGGEVTAKAGTWSNFSNGTTSGQGTVFGKISDDQSLVASLGWEKSDGLGNGVSRIYGQPLWPYPGWVDPKQSPESVPGDGSVFRTPGNWKASVDYNIKGVRLYGRFTHQVQQAGGLFILDPWPQFLGNPSQFKTTVKSYNDQISAIQAKIGSGTATSADSFNLLDLNTKLSALQQQATALNMSQPRIDGKVVEYDDPFWSQVESWHNNRREYVADNIVLDASYDLPIGENTVKLRAGFDGNSNIIRREMRAGYETMQAQERNSLLEEAFGERRYTLGATYLMRNIPKLQLAAGMEQRWDDIGEDLAGRNAQQEKDKHKIVSDILYTNTAVFTEGWYDVNDQIGVDFGMRWDGHTRTIDDGGTINGKLAGVYTPVAGHTVKLIFQTSSNNATADNYEYSRNNFNDDGTAYAEDHFYEKTTTTPTNQSEIVPGVSLEELHQLKPEKVYSFELTSNHDFGHGISMSPSISYNMVRDLFAWSQRLFRVVNVGQYDNLNFDLQADWKSKFLDIGANHAVQMVVNTDVAAQEEVLSARGYDKTKPGWYKQLPSGEYVPVSNSTEQVKLNPVRDQITVDGDNFMSLSTHTSKFWAELKPLPWLTVHNDARVFWGLWGRDSVSKRDDSLGYNTLGIATDPIVKWNASILAELPSDWSIGVYVYDILGVQEGGMAGHTLRWNQSYDIGARDLYSVDLRSYAIQLKKTF